MSMMNKIYNIHTKKIINVTANEFYKNYGFYLHLSDLESKKRKIDRGWKLIRS